MKIEIRETLFWIFLVLALGLLLWNVFGNSHSEFLTLIGIIFMGVLKVWSISDRQIMTDMRIKEGFGKMKRDMGLIKEDMGLIKKKFKINI